MRRWVAAAALLTIPSAVIVAGEPGRVTLVACAPGYPGTTEQAQPSMDDLSRAIATAAGWDASRLGAVYYPSLEEGLARLSGPDAAVALVPLPFYLQYREQLDLEPLLEVVQASGPRQVWSVVARRGVLTNSGLPGDWELTGMAGYSPGFVRRVALSTWDGLPSDATIRFSSRVLSVLRRAAGGEPVGALLDDEQEEALGSLPFAGELEVVARSEPLPGSLVCSVGGRLSSESTQEIVEALLGLGQREDGEELLHSIRMVGFARVDREELGRIEARFDDRGD